MYFIALHFHYFSAIKLKLTLMYVLYWHCTAFPNNCRKFNKIIYVIDLVILHAIKFIRYFYFTSFQMKIILFRTQTNLNTVKNRQNFIALKNHQIDSINRFYLLFTRSRFPYLATFLESWQSFIPQRREASPTNPERQ